MGGKTKVFVIPEKLHALADGDVVLPLYCTADNCNTKEAIDDTIGPPKAGAAQTSVAVATIAFSMVLARLAL